MDPLILPPWATKENWCAGIKRICRYPLPIPRSIPFQDLIVYSDASRSESVSGPRVGGGVVIYQAGKMLVRKCIPLSPTLSIFDAEVTTAVAAITEALEVSTTRFSSDLWILLDNKEVARQLLQIPSCSSQNEFIKFSNLASAWPRRYRLPHTSPGRVNIYWIPSHSGIPGNIQADQAAKEARSLAPPTTTPNPLSIASAKSWLKEVVDNSRSVYWAEFAPISYKNLGITSFMQCPQELTLPRSIVAHIYAARTGHGDFAAYHERFNHQDALTTCSCGALKSPKHFLQCSLPSLRIPKIPRSSGDASKFLLGTSKGASIVAKWIKDTNFFIDICPRS